MNLVRNVFNICEARLLVEDNIVPSNFVIERTISSPDLTFDSMNEISDRTFSIKNGSLSDNKTANVTILYKFKDYIFVSSRSAFTTKSMLLPSVFLISFQVCPHEL